MEHFDHRFVTSLNDLHYTAFLQSIRPWLNIATYHVRQECCLSTLISNYTDRIIHKNAALLQTMYRYNQHHYDCLERHMFTSVTPPIYSFVTFNEYNYIYRELDISCRHLSIIFTTRLTNRQGKENKN